MPLSISPDRGLCSTEELNTKENKRNVLELVGGVDSTLKTLATDHEGMTVPLVLSLEEISHSGHSTLKNVQNSYLRFSSPSFINKSAVANTLMTDCCFSLGSFDQIAVSGSLALSFKAKAKKGAAFSSGDISIPFDLNSLNELTSTTSTKDLRLPVIDYSSASLSEEYFTRLVL